MPSTSRSSRRPGLSIAGMSSADALRTTLCSTRTSMTYRRRASSHAAGRARSRPDSACASHGALPTVATVAGTIELISSDRSGRISKPAWRWRCSCGANKGGRWYRSTDEAMNAAIGTPRGVPMRTPRKRDQYVARCILICRESGGWRKHVWTVAAHVLAPISRARISITT